MIKQQDLNLQASRSVTIQQTELIVSDSSNTKFKLLAFLKKSIHSRFVQEFLRFALYSLLVLILLSILNKNSSSTIYSTVQMEQTDKNIFLRKQIPGLFPPLSTKWALLLSKWSIQTIRGSQIQGNLNLIQKSYQLQFKHFEDSDKSDLLYITKNNCNGHIIMNWQVYGSNIYFSDFEPPQGSMIIPNQPEDEKCILGDGQIVQILKYSTIWTVSEENSKVALFLLIERQRSQNGGANNLVLIANQVKKD